jgi:hypothetical protein
VELGGLEPPTSWVRCAAAPQHPESAECAAGDAAPDAKAAVPDREGSPPVVWDLVPAGGQEVEASTDQPGGEPPERDLVDEFAVAAASFQRRVAIEMAARSPAMYASP